MAPNECWERDDQISSRVAMPLRLDRRALRALAAFAALAAAPRSAYAYEGAGTACFLPLVGLFPWGLLLFVIVVPTVPREFREHLWAKTFVAWVATIPLLFLWMAPVSLLGIGPVCGTSPIALCLAALPAALALFRARKKGAGIAVLAIPVLAALILLPQIWGRD